MRRQFYYSSDADINKYLIFNALKQNELDRGSGFINKLIKYN